jgi:hypothetical protein
MMATNGAAPGYSGLSGADLKHIIDADPIIRLAISDTLQLFLTGDLQLPQQLHLLLYRGIGVATIKPNGRVRPLVIPQTILSFLTRCILSLITEDYLAEANELDLGVMHPAGTETAIHLFQTLLDDKPDTTILAIDFEMAYQTMEPSAMLQTQYDDYPVIYAAIATRWDYPNTITFGTLTVHQTNGTPQGGVESPHLFQTTMHRALQHTRTTHLCTSYLDDTHIKPHTTDDIPHALQLITNATKELGLNANKTKSTIFTLHPLPPNIQQTLQPLGLQFKSGSLRILGGYVGLPEQIQQHLLDTTHEIIDSITPYYSLIEYLTNRHCEAAIQIGYFLITWCLATRFTHLLRTTHPSLSATAADLFDTAIQCIFTRLIQPITPTTYTRSTTDILNFTNWRTNTVITNILNKPTHINSPLLHRAWHQLQRMTLAKQHGGFGLLSAVNHMYPAYLGSLAEVEHTITQALTTYNHTSACDRFRQNKQATLCSFVATIGPLDETENDTIYNDAFAQPKAQHALHRILQRKLRCNILDDLQTTNLQPFIGKPAELKALQNRYSTALLNATLKHTPNHLDSWEMLDCIYGLCAIHPMLPDICQSCLTHANPDENHANACTSTGHSHTFLKIAMYRIAKLALVPVSPKEPLVSSFPQFKPKSTCTTNRRFDILVDRKGVDVTLSGTLNNYTTTGSAATALEKSKHASYAKDYNYERPDLIIVALETRGAPGETTKQYLTNLIRQAPVEHRRSMRETISICTAQARTSRLYPCRFGKHKSTPTTIPTMNPQPNQLIQQLNQPTDNNQQQPNNTSPPPSPKKRGRPRKNQPTDATVAQSTNTTPET